MGTSQSLLGIQQGLVKLEDISQEVLQGREGEGRGGEGGQGRGGGGGAGGGGRGGRGGIQSTKGEHAHINVSPSSVHCSEPLTVKGVPKRDSFPKVLSGKLTPISLMAIW